MSPYLLKNRQDKGNSMNKWAMGTCILAAVFLLLLYGLYFTDKYEKRVSSDKKAVYLNVLFMLEVFVISVSLYLNLHLSIYTQAGDSGYFARIMKNMADNGLFGVYSREKISYPPFFQFSYWALAKVMKYMGIAFDGTTRLFLFCVKLPCIICEFLTAGLLYKTAEGCMREGQRAMVIFMCLLNPGVLYTTGFSCQVDMLYVFFMALCVYLLMNGKLKMAYFVFAVAVLFKLQAVFITPVIAFAVINEVFLKDFSWKRFFQHLAAGLSAIGMILLSYIPFVYDAHSGNIARGGFFSHFSNTTEGYAEASHNACNFWMLMGYNWTWQGEMFGPLSCQTWGKVFIVALVILSVILYWRTRKDVAMYPMLAALLVCGTYCFAVRMMARYLYAAIFLAYLGFACRPNKKRFLCAALLSVTYFFQVGMNYAYPWNDYEKGLLILRITSVFTLCSFAYLVYAIWSEGSSHKFTKAGDDLRR